MVSWHAVGYSRLQWATVCMHGVTLGVHWAYSIRAVGIVAVQWVTVGYRVLQCVTVCYSVFQWAKVSYSGLKWAAVGYNGLQWVTVDYSAF